MIRIHRNAGPMRVGHWLMLASIAVPASGEARELRFTASRNQPNPDFLVSPEALRVSARGREALRLEKGATIKTREPIDPSRNGFSLFLRVKFNEAGDPTIGNQAHNHAVLCHTSMVLIVTWGEVLVWHFPFHGQGKVAEAHFKVKPGQELALGWVLTPTSMVAYVNGLPIYDQKLPVPLREKVFQSGPFIVGGPYGNDRPLSLDVYEFAYSDRPWDEAEMAARTAGTAARLIPENFGRRPLSSSPTLTMGPLQLWVDSMTGQLDGLSHREVPDAPPVRSLDLYRVLDGVCSSECEDRVISEQTSGAFSSTHSGKGRNRSPLSTLTLQCRNDRLRVRINKQYHLDSVTGQLTKSITLRSDKPMIVAVESRTLIDSRFRTGAFYTQWLHHTHQQRLFIPATEVGTTRAAAPEANMQSRLLLLTRPDLGWTYGEVPLQIDGEPVYPAVPDHAFGRKTLITPEGWQSLRGEVELQPGKDHTLITSYRWAGMSHLGFLRDYITRVYRPAFAPQPGSRLSRKHLSCDGTGAFLCNLAHPEGEKLVYNGRPGNWALADLSSLIEKALPESYGTMVIFEGFSHGDLLSDNVYQWVPEDRGGPPYGKTNVFGTSLDEYFRIVKLAERDMPRLRLGRYERTGVLSYVTETPRKRPDILEPPEAGAPRNPSVYALPYFWDNKPAHEVNTSLVVYFDLLGDYFVGLVKRGLPVAYLDWAVPGPYLRRTSRGVHLVSWGEQIAAVRRMARKIHAAGGTYFANLPSGPWTDIGYMEYTPWAADNAKDWRVIADRLQLTKAQEMLPNTTVPLYFQGRDYPLRCLAYNLVPNPFFSGWFDRSGTGPVVAEELLRLRWALREAEMTGALVRPLPWEPGAPPVESCVMRLGDELYVPLIFHGDKAAVVQLTADLQGLLRNTGTSVWRCEFVHSPWSGPADKPFTGDRVALKFTPLPEALDERGVLHLKETLEPESLALVLVGDWSKHPPFAPPKG